MGNSTQRDGDISKLHPAIRDKVKTIRDQLHKENIPFEVFEAFRTPERQAVLKAKRPKVTWVGPWGSIHQYGLAVDFVLKIDGKWSWDDSGTRAKHWARMHELALKHGMTPLFNKAGQLIEQPHIQMVGVSASKLRQGHYPDGGDEIWAETLGDLIDNWQGAGAPPPRPALAAERPPLDAHILADLEAEQSSIPSPHSPAETARNTATDALFQKLHGFVKHWEGGFANHPADKGGATNMGITIGTLADWRNAEVTVDDVRDLTRAEADQIFRARYFSACRCGEMPERLAMVVYNCAVLSGPKRAIKFAQQGFNTLGLTVDGAKLEVDGLMGRLTMGAIKKTDSAVLSEAFMDVQENYLRGLDTFEVFGPGWMNRMAALREFTNTLPQGAGVRPSKKMTISDKVDIEDILSIVSTARGGNTTGSLAQVAEILLQADNDDGTDAARNKALLRTILNRRLGGDAAAPLEGDAATITTGTDGRPPLTPINAALGQTIGRVLNGRKSVSGVVGLTLTALLPKLGLSGDIVDFIASNGDTLLTVFSMITGWGMFGKLDKAIRLMGMVNTVR